MNIAPYDNGQINRPTNSAPRFKKSLPIFLGCFFMLFIRQTAFTQQLFDFGQQDIQQPKIRLNHYPSFRFGTHVNELGYVFNPSWKLNAKGKLRLDFATFARANLSNLGIPGGSLSSINRLQFAFSFGKQIHSFNTDYFFKDLWSSNLSFYYMHYASTDKTNQFSGGIRFSQLIGNKLFRFQFENDALAFLQRDEFRTSVVLFELFWKVKDKLWGVGLENSLWTGTTKGLGFLNFGEIYDLTNKRGGEYSHGILALNVYHQNLSLKIGYDADVIRTGVQDTIHRWIDDGTILKGDKSKDRFFLQISLNAFDWLY